MSIIIEQQEQDRKRREQEQQREQKRREQEQLKLRRVSKRARHRTKPRPPAERKSDADADEEAPYKPPLVFLSKQQVLARIPITGPTLWHWSRTGKFPAPRFIGSRTVWVAAEVDEWMQSRPKRAYKSAGGA